MHVIPSGREGSACPINVASPPYNRSMIPVVQSAPEHASPGALAAWAAQIHPAYAAEERTAIDAAAGLKLDAVSVRAALLLGAPEMEEFDPGIVAEKFGAEVAELIAGVSRMGAIRAAARGAAGDERDAQAENLRKMLLAMVGDIRVVLIKLAERTQALRFLVGTDGDTRVQAARETQDLFAPLANRLGLWQLKWALEELS